MSVRRIEESALYVGEVMHQRLYPVAYRFRYAVFSLLVDLDEAEAGFPGLRWLSHNRFNLISFHDRDHGPRNGEPLRPWIERVLRSAGIEEPLGRVRINAYPRILGYQFNPLTVWYCHNRSGDTLAILCEVSNTFGQFHHYLLHDHGRPLAWPFRATAGKVFHVSPFIDMPMRYHFRFLPPGERLAVHIRETEGEQLMLIATHLAQRQPLTDRTLLVSCLRVPFLTLKVMVLIHWQALKIWLKGVRFYRAPPPPKEEISLCPPKTSRH